MLPGATDPMGTMLVTPGLETCVDFVDISVPRSEKRVAKPSLSFCLSLGMLEQMFLLYKEYTCAILKICFKFKAK